MRIVLGLLLAVGVVLQLLLGGSLLFSSTSEGTGGLSDVSADLVSAEQLELMQSKEDPLRTHRMVLGVALLLLAALQIVSTVVAFGGRGRGLVLAGTGLSAVGVVLVMAVHQPEVLAGIAMGVLVLSLVLCLLVRPKAGEVTT